MKKLSLLLVIPLLAGISLVGCEPVEEMPPPEQPTEQLQ